jgi:hypothetical protein
MSTLPLSSSKYISCWNQPALTFIIIDLTGEDTSSKLLKIYLLLKSTGAHFHHHRFNRSAHILFSAAISCWKCTDEYTQTNIGLTDVPSSQNSVSGTLLGMHRRLYSLDRRFNWCLNLSFLWVDSPQVLTDFFAKLHVDLN